MAQATSTQRWMEGAATPLRGALLGLVLEHPAHGGDLANRLITRFGEAWRIEPKDVYRLLKQLGEEGLLSPRVQELRPNQRAAHVVYHSTERTPEAFACWMETLTEREPMRLALQAKVMVGRDEDIPRLRLALRQHVRECLVLAALVLPSEEEPRSWLALRLDCTRDAVYGVLQTEVDWARRTLRRIDEYAARNS
ncbi:MAG TPA: PadR family transcriptional regulator [Solirubrobacteraceae bacterium]